MTLSPFDRALQSGPPYSVEINDDATATSLPSEAYTSYTINLTGTLTASRSFTLPTEGGFEQGWIIVNQTNQTISVVGWSGGYGAGGVDIPSGATSHVVFDGANFRQISGGAGSGVTDHGALTGLLDNDHPQYQLAASALGLTSATPQPVGVAAVGNGTAAARDNHVHAHGDQAGGTLHAGATTSNPGFMSAADKAKLDSLSLTATDHGALTGLTDDDHLLYLRADGGRIWTQGQNAGGNKLGNLGTPTLAADAATKAYVDSLGGGGGIPAPTAANQLYNSSAASTAAWTASPTVDTIKATTSAEVGTYAAVAASGKGGDSALVAQGGANSYNGGYLAICGGLPGSGGSGGGSGLSPRGDASGPVTGTLCVSAEEVGARKCAALMCGQQMTVTTFPPTAGDGVVILGRCTTAPTSGPGINYLSIYNSNASGASGCMVESTIWGQGYRNRKCHEGLANNGTVDIILGTLQGATIRHTAPSGWKGGTAFGTLYVIVQANNSAGSWTPNGVGEYMHQTGWIAQKITSGSVYYQADLVTPHAGIALTINSTTLEVKCAVTNTCGFTADIYVAWSWEQPW